MDELKPNVMLKITLTISIISFILGILGLITFIKSFNKDNFQAASTSYCIPCSENGNSYKGVDGTSIPCSTIPDYLLTPNGQTALIAAMAKIPGGNHNFKFDTSGNAGTAYGKPESQLEVLNSANTDAIVGAGSKWGNDGQVFLKYDNSNRWQGWYYGHWYHL